MKCCVAGMLLVLAFVANDRAMARDPGTGMAPQQAVPAPLPPGSGADTPGGSARNGVIRPPSTGDRGIRRPVPEAGSTMPVVRPPGFPGGNASVVPK